MNWMAFACVLRRFSCPRITLIDGRAHLQRRRNHHPAIRDSNPRPYLSKVLTYGFSPKKTSSPPRFFLYNQFAPLILWAFKFEIPVLELRDRFARVAHKRRTDRHMTRDRLCYETISLSSSAQTINTHTAWITASIGFHSLKSLLCFALSDHIAGATPNVTMRQRPTFYLDERIGSPQFPPHKRHHPPKKNEIAAGHFSFI